MPRIHRHKRAPVQSERLGSRGLATRERLKAAARRVLERKGYSQMTVADVTGEADVAAGLFHRYFPDLRTLTVEILGEIIDELGDTARLEQGVTRGDWMGRIRSHIVPSVANHALRPGLVRAMNQLADEYPPFRTRLRAFYQAQLELLSAQMPRLFPEAKLTPEESLLISYALAGLSEAALRERYIVRNPALRNLKLSPEELADWLSVLYYRALFAANPPRSGLRGAGRLLAIKEPGRARRRTTTSRPKAPKA
ncbi:MAG TPA: TetR/AcrR family transcriptional regulator [Steroidobacteraceae bacterium]|nr:TetR/AcrR family transcriptional regulator [Steroidobacteraceae bacterium]